MFLSKTMSFAFILRWVAEDFYLGIFRDYSQIGPKNFSLSGKVSSKDIGNYLVLEIVEKCKAIFFL